MTVTVERAVAEAIEDQLTWLDEILRHGGTGTRATIAQLRGDLDIDSWHHAVADTRRQLSRLIDISHQGAAID